MKVYVYVGSNQHFSTQRLEGFLRWANARYVRTPGHRTNVYEITLDTNVMPSSVREKLGKWKLAYSIGTVRS